MLGELARGGLGGDGLWDVVGGSIDRRVTGVAFERSEKTEM